MYLSRLLLLCCVLGLGSARNKPGHCNVRKADCGEAEKLQLDMIQDTLSAIQQTLADSLTEIATSLKTLVCKSPNSI